MKESEKFDTAIKRAIYMATQARAEYLCPEHLLLAFMQQPEFVEALVITGGADHRAFAEQLTNYLNTQEHVPGNVVRPSMLRLTCSMCPMWSTPCYTYAKVRHATCS